MKLEDSGKLVALSQCLESVRRLGAQLRLPPQTVKVVERYLRTWAQTHETD